MEQTLGQLSQEKWGLSLDIADVDGGAATLFILNGGTWLPIPSVGLDADGP